MRCVNTDILGWRTHSNLQHSSVRLSSPLHPSPLLLPISLPLQKGCRLQSFWVKLHRHWTQTQKSLSLKATYSSLLKLIAADARVYSPWPCYLLAWHWGSVYLIWLLVPGHHAHRLDEGMPWIINASLDGLIQSVSLWSGFFTQFCIESRSQVTGHAIVMFPQVWIFCTIEAQT